MKVPLHVVEARRERLRESIRIDGFLPLAEICRRLEVSEATARRDLAAVAQAGQITRTRGGALADYNTGFASHGRRAAVARTAKGRIAAAALRRVPRAGRVFLDAGTTIQALARALRQRGSAGLTVVTNSLSVATVLGGAVGVELHLLGGMFLHRQSLLLGEAAVAALRTWKFDVAFLGGEGMDRAGITNSHEQIARFQQAVLDRAEDACFCLDATKAGRTAPHLVGTWRQLKGAALITDASPAALAAAGVGVSPCIYVRA